MLRRPVEYLARTRNVNGTVRLIFQPRRSSWAAGGDDIEDGLFERWPVDAVFRPFITSRCLELGKLHFRDGAMMAAVDNWGESSSSGKGSHGSNARAQH